MYDKRKSLICIANPGGRESKIQRESKFSLSAVAKTIGSISVTGVNVQQALLAKCCSQSGAELQLSDAVLPLEIRTHCLLYLLYQHAIAFSWQNPSSHTGCVVLFSFFFLHLAPLLWVEKSLLQSLRLSYWCHPAFNMPFNTGRILLAKQCYVPLHPVQCLKWLLFLNRCAVTVHGMSGLAFSTVLQLIYHSSAPSSSHSTYTPLSYILSNALAFTYMFLFKKVAVIGISHWNALFSGNCWFK